MGRIGAQEIKFFLMELVQIDLTVLQGTLLDEFARSASVFNRVTDSVIGAERFMGSVPETKGVLRDLNVKAAFEVLQRAAG